MTFSLVSKMAKIGTGYDKTGYKSGSWQQKKPFGAEFIAEGPINLYAKFENI
jgi:hypothetical protein